MEAVLYIVLYFIGFVWILFATDYFANYFKKIHLPLITGFIVTGVIAGPYVLGLISNEAITELHFISDLSLAFIAFAAGAELYLKDLRGRLKSIAWNTFGQLVVTFVMSSIVIYFLAEYIPFMAALSSNTRVAISILMATIFVARSPSSAIAVIHELRAKGPFTQTVMGVTVIKDVLVIILFAICISVAKYLILQHPFDIAILAVLVLEIAVSMGLGVLIGKLINLILYFSIGFYSKAILLLSVGWGVFVFTDLVKVYSLDLFGFEVLFEPLLICIVGSFAVTNYSKYRAEYQFILHKIGPYVYMAFFTLIGAMISLELLTKVWLMALGLFLVRLISMIIGAYIGSTLAKDDPLHRKIGWMPYVTQAGVGLGLAVKVAYEFPVWGNEFSTIVISVIVLNQFAGPPLFKWALNRIGESHKRAIEPGFDGFQDAIIFGLEDQSIALKKLLKKHHWEVMIATLKDKSEIGDITDIEVKRIKGLTLNTLDLLNAKKADAVILMLSDEENYKLCELFYEFIGTKSIVVRLNDRKYFKKFHDLGCLIVEPDTAIVSLLDNFVRSPVAASMLLGTEEGQSTIDIEVKDRSLHGIALRNLRLPSDVIVLSVKRKGQSIISHGYTRLRRKDIVTVVGSPESLEKVQLMFEKLPQDSSTGR